MLLPEKPSVIFTLTFDEESKRIVVDVMEDEDESRANG